MTSMKQKKDYRLSVKIKGKELVTQHITKYVNSYNICTVKLLSNVSHETEERE